MLIHLKTKPRFALDKMPQSFRHRTTISSHETRMDDSLDGVLVDLPFPYRNTYPHFTNHPQHAQKDGTVAQEIQFSGFYRTAIILINGPLAVIHVKNKRGTRKRKLHVETDLRYL